MIYVLVAAVTTINANNLITIEAYPTNTTSLEICSDIHAPVMWALKTETVKNTVCWDSIGKTGVVSVIAYVRPRSNIVTIFTKTSPTTQACDELGRTALTYKIVPGPMSYSCFELN